MVERSFLWVIVAFVAGFVATGAAVFGSLVNFSALTAPGMVWLAGAASVAAFAGLAGLAGVGLRRRRRRRRRELARQDLLTRVKSTTADNIKNLRGVRRVLANPELRGEIHRAKWFEFLEAFVAEKIEPALTSEELAACRADRRGIIDLIDKGVLADGEPSSTAAGFSPAMTAAEFEHWCAEALRSAGWNARVNASDRVRGVDIIATKRGRRITLHCALDPRRVGASTLETAEAGRGVEDGDFAVVVTGGKPASPMELPAAGKVVLVDHRALVNLDDILGAGPSGPATAPTSTLPRSAPVPFPPDGKTETAETARRPRAVVRAARALGAATRRVFGRAPKDIYASAERAPWRDRRSPGFVEPIDDFQPTIAPPAVATRPHDEPSPLPSRTSSK